MALLEYGVHHRRSRGLPRLLVPDRDLPGVDLRLRAVLGAGQGRRRDPPPADGAGEVTDHCGSTWRRVGRRWFGFPRARRRPGPRLHRRRSSSAASCSRCPCVIALIAENTGHVRAVGEMTGDRPGSVHGPRDRRRRRRHRALHRGRRLAHHHLRREHRRDGRHPGVLDRRLLRGGRSSRSCSACRPKFGARRRARRPAGCSAGSP